jgi:hypothetical protein
MSDNLDFNSVKEKEPIPTFLKVLCVLSFVFMGFSILSNIASISHGPFSKDEMLKDKEIMADEIAKFQAIDFEYGIIMTKQLMVLKEILNNNSLNVALLSLFVTFIGMFGVVKMKSGFKIGFHLYIIYSLLYAVQNYMFSSVEYIPSLILILNLLISLIFILMYSRNLKWMK